jgi:DNA-binding NarL/FixJ family response regulator
MDGEKSAMIGTTRSADATDVIDNVLRRARSRVLVVDPGDRVAWPWPVEMTPHVEAAAGRDCEVRVLFGRSPSDLQARRFARKASAAGALVRTGFAPDQAMLAIDGRAALLPGADRTVAVVTEPATVRILCGFGELAWSQATAITIAAPVAVERRDVESAHRSMQQRIVALLADGAKDETIARALGMSVRTCRRHIADIMHRLDAVSRFQAGANAVRLGLAGIDPTPGSLTH